MIDDNDGSSRGDSCGSGGIASSGKWWCKILNCYVLVTHTLCLRHPFLYVASCCDVLADNDDAEEEGEKGNYDRAIMPEVVVCLEANEEFLRQRVMNLPESVVAGTHNTEEGLLRRLAEYRVREVHYLRLAESRPTALILHRQSSLKGKCSDIPSSTT